MSEIRRAPRGGSEPVPKTAAAQLESRTFSASKFLVESITVVSEIFRFISPE